MSDSDSYSCLVVFSFILPFSALLNSQFFIFFFFSFQTYSFSLIFFLFFCNFYSILFFSLSRHNSFLLYTSRTELDNDFLFYLFCFLYVQVKSQKKKTELKFLTARTIQFFLVINVTWKNLSSRSRTRKILKARKTLCNFFSFSLQTEIFFR